MLNHIDSLLAEAYPLSEEQRHALLRFCRRLACIRDMAPSVTVGEGDCDLNRSIVTTKHQTERKKCQGTVRARFSVRGRTPFMVRRKRRAGPLLPRTPRSRGALG